jgi:hypothetical protein
MDGLIGWMVGDRLQQRRLREDELLRPNAINESIGLSYAIAPEQHHLVSLMSALRCWS